MTDLELNERFWRYYATRLHALVEARNIANRVFQVPKDKWVTYDHMLKMQEYSGGRG